ncbi:MAG: cobalamin-binding protein [Chloroflexi bacterium]|nr:cobalamin-binding protein [Chloroflexota bacterium]
MRIVSLLPSSTEIVCALGLEADLVGRSHECDYPAGIAALPALTAPRFDPTGTSLEVDERVKAALQDATSVYTIDAELLEQLAPDVVITQTQCEVCAVSYAEVERVVCDQLHSSAAIVALEPNTLADVHADIQRVADAVGLPERGVQVVTDMQRRMQAIADETTHVARPRVATLEWLDPLMAAGNWIPELVEMAGGNNLFGEVGVHSPWLRWDELLAADPDMLVILPCGYDIPKAREELQRLERRPAWTALTAVRANRVYVTDGNQYFNRPGPRLAESLEILAEIMHPECFDFGHQGRGWERY